MIDSPHLDGIEFLSVCVWFCVFFGEKVESGEKMVSDDDSDDGFDDGDLLHRVIARIKVCADKEKGRRVGKSWRGKRFCNGGYARAWLAPS